MRLCRPLLSLAALLALLAAGAAAAQAPVLRAPSDARPAPRSRHDHRRVLDCAEHGVWSPPPGWTTHALDRATLALAPDGSAALVRTPARPPLRDDARFSALVAATVQRLTGAPPTLGPIVGIDRNRWRRERTADGAVTVSGTTLAVLARASRSDAAWIALHRESDTAARAAIEQAIESWAMLTSHACECGYDCDHPTR